MARLAAAHAALNNMENSQHVIEAGECVHERYKKMIYMRDLLSYKKYPRRI